MKLTENQITLLKKVQEEYKSRDGHLWICSNLESVGNTLGMAEEARKLADMIQEAITPQPTLASWAIDVMGSSYQVMKVNSEYKNIVYWMREAWVDRMLETGEIN